MFFKYYKLLLLIPFVVVFISCQRNRFDIDVSKIKVTIKIDRLEKDLFSIPPDSISKKVPFLKQKYPIFFTLYNQEIIGLGNPDNVAYPSYLNRFLIDYRVIQANEKIKNIYPDTQFLVKGLTDPFKRYKYYFPEKSIPRIYTCISGFNESIIIGSGFIAIALDKYLGSHEPIYEQLGWDKYKRNKMHKEMIPIDLIKMWITSEYEFNDSIDNLVNHMIYEGKVMYALDALFPDAPDTLKFAYDPAQWKWANKNEKKIWTYFVENKLLFSNDPMNNNKYIRDAPFTTAFSANSAPRTGIFIGYKIVKSFMDHKPRITLEQLMNIRNYQKILSTARYDP